MKIYLPLLSLGITVHMSTIWGNVNTTTLPKLRETFEIPLYISVSSTDGALLSLPDTTTELHSPLLVLTSSYFI
jgi:phosphatidylserine decarboxylase